MTSYREAGVDLDAADRHIVNISQVVTSTWSDRVVGGFGGFAAGVGIPDGFDDPVLMMSTDGVGTKLDIARRTGTWDGVGHDLAAMCVDDLAASGAQPIGFVDYMAVGSLEPVRDAAIVSSIADACQAAGIPLLGGETAEHPGVMEAGAVDLAGAAVGVVERGNVLGPERVQPGDVVIALHSPNLRSNGFSLVRAVMGEDLEKHADSLLAPSVIYSPSITLVSHLLHSAAHITGGGIAANLARALPQGLGVTIEKSSWTRPEVFDLVAGYGVDEQEMWRTFNNGVGFCLLTSEMDADEVMDGTAPHSPKVIAKVQEGEGVTLV